MRFPASLLLAILGTLTGAARVNAQPQNVAPTDPKSPADERKALKVPAGFEVQLVAAEPDIQKPMQMAFDAKGRLWVTTSRLYPFAAPAGEKATDKLFVLSDFGPDGKARKVVTFADNLNIPIGILPLPDCNSCLVSSVGVIRKLTDTDGDGKADKSEDLFTGFGSRDTHGMYNSFTHLPDGWVYACHGYLNDSRVKGKDGHEVHMNSGNTFRFRPDGSRIEVYTRGQVNPFGMTVDPWFNLYTADCHSKPITQLIRGAHYDSFGKPHDGLGYAPHVTRHDHGSTALCGLAWYDADHFPASYKGTMFLGNVMTNRVNFDKIEWKGSTPVAVEQPDFVTSDDPWFRPVDIKLGPDGALYISDFYNRIIGHYEVDLKHPGRDKHRGRIWRVIYKGEPGASAPGFKPPVMPGDLTKAREEQLLELLGSSNITTRLFVTHEFIRRHSAGQKQDVVQGRKEDMPKDQATRALVHVGWAGLGSGELTLPQVAALLNREDLARRFGPDGVGFVFTHALRAVASAPVSPPEFHVLALKALGHTDPQAIQAAVMALSAHPRPDSIKPLAAFIPTIPTDDTHLRHAARIALRNSLAAPGGWDGLVYSYESPAADRVIADAALGVPTEAAANHLAKHLLFAKPEPSQRVAFAEHIARYGERFHRVYVNQSVRNHADDRALQVALLQASARGVQSRGGRFTPFEVDLAVEVGAKASADAATPVLTRAALDMLRDVAALKTEPSTADVKRKSFDITLAVVTHPKQPADTRKAAIANLAAIDATRAADVLGPLFRDDTVPMPLREQAAAGLAASMTGRTILYDGLKTAPYRLAVPIAAGLAGSSTGAEVLIAACAKGEASPRLLQEKLVLDRLRAARVRDLDKRVKDLTAGLPSAEKRLQDLISTRGANYKTVKPDAEAGKKVYAAACAACHQIGGQGGKVGPNLDGIGNRGLDRLLEDVLDPNRNVDVAFRATTLSLADGRALTGMLVREEGAVYILADAEGKEQRIPKADVEKKTITAMSPMPANVAEKVKEDEFYHLLAYLLEMRVK